MKLRALLGFRSRLIKPCSQIFSVFVFRFHKPSFSSFRAPRFRIHRRSRLRSTRVVRFRKPFSIRAIKFPRCHPKTRLRFRRPVAVKRSLRLRLRFKRKRRASAVTTPTSASVTRRRAGGAGAGASGGGHNNGERFGEKIAELLSVFKSSRRSKELEQVVDLKSVSDMGSNDHHHHHSNANNLVSNGSIRDGKEPFPSPITPAFVRKLSDSKKDNSSSDSLNGDDEEDEDEEEDDNGDVVDAEVACRNFESYLAEMIVEDRKVTDLMDVEELLYCWRSLKSPMFVDLVGHFYGEMCKDLFFTGEEEEVEEDGSNTTKSN